MDTKELLNKYFAGETSLGEEAALRQFFAQNSFNENFEEEAALLRFINDEAIALSALAEVKKEEASKRRSQLTIVLSSVSGIAATLILGMVLLKTPLTSGKSYVWIDGKKITDKALVQDQAERSFNNVKTSNSVIEDQLNFMLE